MLARVGITGVTEKLPGGSTEIAVYDERIIREISCTQFSSGVKDHIGDQRRDHFQKIRSRRRRGYEREGLAKFKRTVASFRKVRGS